MVASAQEEGHHGKTNLRDKAYDSFIESLLASRIRPGQFLSQRELVVITGMPLGAIRELIPRLEADKLIETVPQRGMQITAIDLALVRDAFQLWIILEREAAVSYARSASDEEIQALARAHADLLGRAQGQVDLELLEEAKRLEWKLHDTFIEAYDNDIVSEIYRVNSVKIQLIKMARDLVTEQAVIASIKEQLAVIEALKLRDTCGVSAAVEAHLEASLRRCLGI